MQQKRIQNAESNNYLQEHGAALTPGVSRTKLIPEQDGASSQNATIVAPNNHLWYRQKRNQSEQSSRGYITAVATNDMPAAQGNKGHRRLQTTLTNYTPSQLMHQRPGTSFQKRDNTTYMFQTANSTNYQKDGQASQIFEQYLSDSKKRMPKMKASNQSRFRNGSHYSRPGTSLRIRGMRDGPEETINFLAPSSKERSQGASNGSHSNERVNQKTSTNRRPSKLLDQISAFNLDSIQESKTKKLDNSDLKPFTSKNIGINSRNRIVDATMTAYKLLESAFINQAGNPNNLEEQFNFQKQQVMNSLTGNADLSKKNLNNSRTSRLRAVKKTQKVALIGQFEGMKDYNTALDQEVDVANKLQRSQTPNDLIIKKKKTNKRTGGSKSTRRGGGNKCCQNRGWCDHHQRHPDDGFNDRLYQILEKATLQQEQLEQQLQLQKQNAAAQPNTGAPGSFLPMFSSNHIQNLTINAQPGFNIGEITQVTQVGNNQNPGPQPISYQIQYAPENGAQLNQRDMFNVQPNQTPDITPGNSPNQDQTKKVSQVVKTHLNRKSIGRKEDSAQSPASALQNQNPQIGISKRLVPQSSEQNSFGGIFDHNVGEQVGYHRMFEVPGGDSSTFNIQSDINIQSKDSINYQSKYSQLKHKVTKHLVETNSYLMPPKGGGKPQQNLVVKQQFHPKTSHQNKYSYHRTRTMNNKKNEADENLQLFTRNNSNSSAGSGATNNSKSKMKKAQFQKSLSLKKKMTFKKKKAQTLALEEIQPTSKYFYDGISEASPPSIPSQNQMRIMGSIKTNMSSSQYPKPSNENGAYENEQIVQLLKEKMAQIKENNIQELDNCDPRQQKEKFKELIDQALDGFLDVMQNNSSAIGGVKMKDEKQSQNIAAAQGHADIDSIQSSEIPNDFGTAQQMSKRLLGIKKLDSSRSQDDVQKSRKEKSGSSGSNQLSSADNSKKSKRSIKSASVAENKLEKFSQPQYKMQKASEVVPQALINQASPSQPGLEASVNFQPHPTEYWDQAILGANKMIEAKIPITEADDPEFNALIQNDDDMEKHELDSDDDESSDVELDTQSFQSAKKNEQNVTFQAQKGEIRQKDELQDNEEQKQSEQKKDVNEIQDDENAAERTSQISISKVASSPERKSPKAETIEFKNVAIIPEKPLAEANSHRRLNTKFNHQSTSPLLKMKQTSVQETKLEKFLYYLQDFEFQKENFQEVHKLQFDDIIETSQKLTEDQNQEEMKKKAISEQENQQMKKENLITLEMIKPQTLERDHSEQYSIYFESLIDRYSINLRNKIQEEFHSQEHQRQDFILKFIQQVSLKSKIAITKIETENRLLGMYDINVKSLICTNIRTKFQRNKEFLASTFMDEDLLADHDNSQHCSSADFESKIYGKQHGSLRSSGIQRYLLPLENQISLLYSASKDKSATMAAQYIPAQPEPISPSFVFIQAHDLESLDLELKDKYLHCNHEQSDYRKQRTHKLVHLKQKEKDDRQYKNYQLYSDMVWKQNSNKRAFVMFDNPDMPLQRNKIINLVPQGLFEAKNIAVELGLTDQIEWDQVEFQHMRLKVRISNNLQFYYEFFSEVDRYVLEWLNHDYLAHVYVQPHEKIMKALEKSYNAGIAPNPPLYFSSVKSIAPEELIEFINRRIYSKRFKKIVTHYDFRTKLQNIESKQENAQRKYEAKNLESNFKEYLSYHVIHNSKSFNEILFMHKLNSLYYNLYDVEKDFELFLIIENLFQKAKDLSFAKSQLKSADIGDLSEQASLPGSEKPVAAAMSAADSQKSHDYASSLQRQLQSERLTTLVSDIQYYNRNVFGYQRQDAENKFNLQFCEFKIMQSLESRMMRVKDSVNMFYKRIETLIDQNDNDINALARQFGYKSVLVRDTQNKYIMEVFMPCVITRGKEKLQIQAEKLHNPKSFKELKLQKEKLQNAKKKNKKVFQAILVPEFDTDDSMKDIDYEDIISNSDISDIDDEDSRTTPSASEASSAPKNKRETRRKETKHKLQKYKQSHQANSTNPKAMNYDNFGEHTTALEHYNNLRKARDKESIKESMKNAGSFLEDNEKSAANQFIKSFKCSHDKNGELFTPANQTSKIFKVVDEEHMEEQGDRNFFKQMKNKFKVDHIIQQTQKGVNQDNLNHMIKLEAKKAQLMGQFQRKFTTSAARPSLLAGLLAQKTPAKDQQPNSNTDDAFQHLKTQIWTRNSNLIKSDESNTNLGGETQLAQEAPDKGVKAAAVEEKTEFKQPGKSKELNFLKQNQSINTQVEFGNVGVDDKLQVYTQANLPNLNIICKDISSFTHSEDQAISQSAILSQSSKKPGSGRQNDLNENVRKINPDVKIDPIFIQMNTTNSSISGMTQLQPIKVAKKPRQEENKGGAARASGLVDEVESNNDHARNLQVADESTPSHGAQQAHLVESENMLVNLRKQLTSNVTRGAIKKQLETGVALAILKNQATTTVDYKSDDSKLGINNETQILNGIKAKRQLKVMQQERQNKKRVRILETLHQVRTSFTQNPKNKLKNKEGKITAQQLFQKMQGTGFSKGTTPRKKASQSQTQPSKTTLKSFTGHTTQAGGVNQNVNKIKAIVEEQAFQRILKNAEDGEKANKSMLYLTTPSTQQSHVNTPYLSGIRRMQSLNNKKDDVGEARSKSERSVSEQSDPVGLETKAVVVVESSRKSTGRQQVDSAPRSRSQHLAELRNMEQEEQSAKFVERMHAAITTRNRGLMEDVLKRYQGNLNDILDQENNSLLILAAMQGDYHMIDVLLAKGINANLQNDQGNTALHFACLKGLHKCIDTLIAFEVDENIENEAGETAWQMTTK